MKVIKKNLEFESDSGTAVTVGSFDGVHRGHQAIFERLNSYTSDNNLLSTIVTFDPHPRKVLGSGGQIKILTTLEEKVALFKKIGIDLVQIIHFTKEFSKLSYIDFVKNILVNKLKVRHMVIGHDHHFGRNREGGIDKLRELGEQHGFSVEEVPPLTINGDIISSSIIRKFLEDGNVEKSSELLGRNYSISGKVVKGDSRGRELGYPTANIQLDDTDKVLPKRGVYAVDVIHQDRLFKAMMNIGNRPTFNFDPLTLEVHIFNFDDSIYGNTLEIQFKKYIREEKEFDSVAELKTQLDNDKIKCQNL
jgi:riboflavin kinase/FMN adenylyltransferase